jgi:hypothetical protein
MKLTEKDKSFLGTLKQLMEERQLWVDYKPGQPGYLILRGTYGDHTSEAFGMTRQGVRWRFGRIMDQYISAFETILFIERIFGSQLREHAMRISRERYELRQEYARNAPKQAISTNPRRQTADRSVAASPSEM